MQHQSTAARIGVWLSVIFCWLVASSGPTIAATAPAAPTTAPVLPEDTLETQTGVFDSDYPLPPEKESSKLVEVLAQRHTPAVGVKTRLALWERAIKDEQNQAKAAHAGPGKNGGAPAPPGEGPRRLADRGPYGPASFQLYVPAAYRPGDLFGVVVWMSAGPRGGWQPQYAELCDKYHLIWIAPQDVGNDRFVPWRKYMALEALWQARRHFTLDEQRTYISGISGGGRISSEGALQFSDFFSGGFYIVGCNYYRDLPLPEAPNRFYAGFWRSPSSSLLARAKKEGRYVILTGTHDPNLRNCGVVYNGYMKDGFTQVTYLEVPDMGHTMPPPDWYEKGLAALDAPLPSADTLLQQAAGFEKRNDMGQAYVAYARAAARAAPAGGAEAKAAAIYSDFRRQLASLRQTQREGPKTKADVELKALHKSFAPLLDAIQPPDEARATRSVR